MVKFPNGEVFWFCLTRGAFNSYLSVEDILLYYIRQHISDERGKPMVFRVKDNNRKIPMKKAMKMLGTPDTTKILDMETAIRWMEASK